MCVWHIFQTRNFINTQHQFECLCQIVQNHCVNWMLIMCSQCCFLLLPFWKMNAEREWGRERELTKSKSLNATMKRIFLYFWCCYPLALWTILLLIILLRWDMTQRHFVLTHTHIYLKSSACFQDQNFNSLFRFTGVTINERRRRNMPKNRNKSKWRKEKKKMNCYTVPKTRHFSLNSFASVVK